MRQALLPLIVCLTVLNAFAAQPTYRTLPIGSPVPDFKLTGTDGKTWRLRDFSKSKILVVLFTGNHCPTAQTYEERIKQLVTDYQSRGVGFVAINPNSPAGVRSDELGDTDLDELVLGDADKYKLIEAIDPEWNGALPHTLLVSPWPGMSDAR